MQRLNPWGLGIAAVGVFLLLRELDVLPDVSVGSLIVLGIGLWLLAGAFSRRHGWLVGLGVTAAGIVMVLRNLEVIDPDFSLWPIVLIVLGLAIVLGSGMPPHEGDRS